jgi:hypothetical protein
MIDQELTAVDIWLRLKRQSASLSNQSTEQEIAILTEEEPTEGNQDK